MEQLTLKTGRTVFSGKVKDYLRTVITAEQSGEEFPIKLNHVWEIGFTTKGSSVRALKKKFIQDVDYQVFNIWVKNLQGGRCGKVLKRHRMIVSVGHNNYI